MAEKKKILYISSPKQMGGTSNFVVGVYVYEKSLCCQQRNWQ